MRCKREVAVCCMLLLCASLAWAGSKPVQLPSNSFAVQQALHEESAPTVQQLNPRDCLRPIASEAEAIQFLEREAWRVSLKGERQAGDDCAHPISVTLGAGDLPYVTSDTTMGRYNDYWETDLDKYDGGEDIIYELTLTEAMSLRISVLGSSWTGVAIDTGTPGFSCLATATDHAGAPVMDVDLAAGTYFLMIDTWPSPDWTDFTLSIDSPPLPCEVPCPGGATMEGEPDCYDNSVDNFNGGCNSSPYVFSDISCDETVCGKSGTFLYYGSSYRDTDWYRLELTEPREITWTVKAEFPLLIFIIDAGSENCSDYAILSYTTGSECEEISLTEMVGSGVYWLWAGPSVFTGVPCDGIGSHYVGTVTCAEPPPCEVEYSVAAPGTWTGNTCGGGNDCGLRGSEEHMYEVSIPYDGMWTFSLCGSSFDTYLYIGTTCCGQEVGYNDDFCGLQSEITAFCSAGLYYVDIEAYSTSQCGAYVLDISEVIGPDNDFCQNATDLGTLESCVPVVVEGDNTGATSDCYALSYPEAWLKFTLPTVMDLSIAYCGCSPAFLNGYIVLDQSCPCSGSFWYASNWNNTECGDGNYTLYWEELPAGTYYWPILTDAGYNAEGPYTITVHGTAWEPCEIDCDYTIMENEPIENCQENGVDNFNGGCNSSPAVFSPITCGDTVLGTSGTFLYYGSSYRDTDWYLITLYQPATLTWQVIAQFDLLIFVIDAGSGNCMDYTILGSATADDCEFATLTFDVDAGDYWLWAGPSVFSGVPCGAEYCGTVTTDPPTACTPVGACCLPDGTCEVMPEADCDAQEGAYQGDDTACEEPPPPPPPECEDPDAVITIEVMCDYWPYETTWELVENGYGVVATGGPYSSSWVLYTHNIDVCSTSCYTFTIFDAWGDGIYAPGGYTVYYEGGVVASTMGSGWYGDSETVENIGGCGGGGGDCCQDPDAVVTIEIMCDYWPYETTWELVEVGCGVVATGGPYSSSWVLYTHNIDVCSTSCYSWTIYDDWGDGIYSPGGYTIYYEGEVVADCMGSGWYGDEETVGGIGAGCGGCADPDTTITVEIMTDWFPTETTWQLVEEGVGMVASGGPYYYSETLFTHVIDVCSTSCYTWTIFDSYGDGICCGWGYGYYNIYYGGDLVATGGQFGSSDTVEEIGEGCVPPLGACWIGHCGTCVDTTDFCCEYVGGVFQGYGNSCEAAPPPPCAELDLKPTSCPNSFNRGSHGVLPVALISSEDVDVMDVDISTIRLIRDDLVGGEVPPHEGPPGPHTEYADVGMPFDNEGCECIEGGPDGVVDISMKFKTDDVVDMLELDSWPSGTMVPLVIKGNLLDGSPFATYVDCLRLVPANGAPGQMTVTSNAPECWIDVYPMDNTLDMGGFPTFTRAYDNGIVVTLTATDTVPERPFRGWKIDGVLQTTQRSIQITSDGAVEVKAVYGRVTADSPPVKQGQQGAVPRP